MATFGNEKSRKEFRYLICCSPAKLVVTGPSRTGKLEFVLEEFLNHPQQDTIEVDGSVDGARKVNEFIRFQPTFGDTRVAIIDGRKSVSDAAQDAYLKMCEEPPESAVIVIVSDDFGSLNSALQSRVNVVNWYPLSSDEMDLYVASMDIPPKSFAAEAACGRIGVIKPVQNNLESMLSLYASVQNVTMGSYDFVVPKLILGWSKLEEEEKDAAIMVCQFALRNTVHGGMSRFISTMVSTPSANAELHWWRACI